MAESGSQYAYYDDNRLLLLFEWELTNQNYLTRTSDVHFKLSVKAYRQCTVNLDSLVLFFRVAGIWYKATVSQQPKDDAFHIAYESDASVKHDDNGDGVLEAMFYIYSPDIPGAPGSIKDVPLPPMPGPSTLEVGEGVLGQPQTIKVIPKVAEDTTHMLYYSNMVSLGLGVVNPTPLGYIIGMDGPINPAETSGSWTPPLSLAEYNTTGTQVPLALTLVTKYNYKYDRRESTNFTIVWYKIPDDVKPSLSLDVTDTTGYLTKYGGCVQGLSKLDVTLKPTLAAKSAIKSYHTKIGDSEYTADKFTTDVLTSGSLLIDAEVRDGRDRKGEAHQTLTVFPYKRPIIGTLKVNRCNMDGSANEGGEYVRVTFRATVSPVDDKNSARYVLRYKKTTEEVYTEHYLSSYANLYDIEGGVLIKADTGSSYNVELQVTDDFYTSTRATTASTAFTLMHWSADGTGLGIGKVSEVPNLLDVGLPTRFNGPVQFNGPLLGGSIGKVLWSGSDDLTEGVELSDTVSNQTNGIVLVFGQYNDSGPYNRQAFFVPKWEIGLGTPIVYTVLLGTHLFAQMGSKHLTLYNNQIVGRASNAQEGDGASGIHYNNGAFMLQAVLGI